MTTTTKPTTADAAAQASIGAAARELHLPTVRTEAVRLAEIADRERQTHLRYLAEVLAAEVDDRTERRRTRRINDAKFPRLKRLADFNIDAVPGIAPAILGQLAGGHYMDAGEPVVLLGDSGTGKSHLLIGLGLAACEQGRRVRYITTAQLVNELVEAADERVLSRVVGPLRTPGPALPRPIPTPRLCRACDGRDRKPWWRLRSRWVGGWGCRHITGFRGRRGACRWAGSGRAVSTMAW